MAKEIATPKEVRLMRLAYNAGRQSKVEEAENPYYKFGKFGTFKKWLSTKFFTHA